MSFLAALSLFVLLAPAVLAASASQLQHNGVTWYFDRSVEYGRFVNGDYWVVGPVTVVSVSPAWDESRHGAMLDPSAGGSVQGYRRGVLYPFSDDARVTFPLALTPTAQRPVLSLVSTVGLQEIIRGGSKSGVDKAAVLTIVSAPVPAGHFRPPYVAGPKPMRRITEIDYGAIPLLPLPVGVTMPDLSQVLTGVWLQAMHRGDVGASIIPDGNVPAYSRDAAKQVSNLALAMMIDTPQRQEYVHRMVQAGIDLYHVHLHNGDAWRAFGGFGNGRKWPILFAGIVLRDDAMKRPIKTTPGVQSRTGTVDKFGEDGHTWLGQPSAEFPEGRPLFGQDCVAGQYQNYIDTGRGAKDCRDPAGLAQGIGYRICCSSMTWVGYALAARLMNAMSLWDHPAFFQYVDWWVEFDDRSQHTAGTFPSAFVEGMWRAYRKARQAVEGEAASALKSSTLANLHAGFTGSGYLDFGPAGAWAEWNAIHDVGGGTRSIALRYANGTKVTRRCILMLNGVEVGTVAFPPTGSWTAWSSVNVQLTLANGANRLRLTVAPDSSGGPNLDRIDWTQ